MSEVFESAVILFNVTKSCLGAGIINFPYVFQKYGPALVFYMTLLSGVASVLGVFAYINLNRKYHKNNSISTLSTLIISSYFKIFVDLVVIAKCIVVAACYMNSAQKIISKIPLNTGIKLIDSNQSLVGKLFSFFGSILLIPSILEPSLSGLKNFSYLGIGSIFLLIFISIVQTRGITAEPTGLSSDSNILTEIGTFVFGFTCHQSILNIHNETKITDTRLKILIAIAFVLVGVLYFSFGYINYKAFMNLPDITDVFLIWDKNFLTNLGSLLFATSLIISVPFQVHPAKAYLSDMFEFKKLGKSISAIGLLVLAFILSNLSCFEIKFVSQNITKPMNTLICFGFPLIYTLVNKDKKSLYDLISSFYLGIFVFMCVRSFFVK